MTFTRERIVAPQTRQAGDEEAWLTGLRCRDADALTMLVKEHARPLYRAALGLGVPAADAEDLVQDVFIVCLENLDRFEGRSRVRTWLWGILRNKAREYFRDHRREQPTDDEDLETFEARFDARGAWRCPPADLDRQLESAEAGAAIRHCLDGLGQRQREVFVLREIEAMNVGDISSFLGLTINHCGVLIHRARMRLQSCLEHAGWGAAKP